MISLYLVCHCRELHVAFVKMFAPSLATFEERSKLAHHALSDEQPYHSTQSTMMDEGDANFLALRMDEGDAQFSTLLHEESVCGGGKQDVPVGIPLEGIQNGDVTVAGVSALAAVADRGDSDIVATLVSLPDCANWEIRASAIEALVKVAKRGDRNVIGAISKCLKDDDPIVKYTAWEAVGCMEDGLSSWGADY